MFSRPERISRKQSKKGKNSAKEEIREGRDLRPKQVSLVAVAVAGAATLVISGVRLVDFGHESASLHIALETAIATISIVAAHLVYGRFRQDHTRSDLFLFYALSAFALTNLLFGALPAAVGTAYPEGFAIWAPLAGAMIGASLLLLAAATPSVPVRPEHVRTLDRIAAGAILAACALAAFALAAWGQHPTPGPAFAADRWSLDTIQEHPQVILDVVVALLFFAAGALFTKKAEIRGEELMVWLAVGSIVAGFARFNFFLFPTHYSNWISIGDVLRVTFYVLLFLGTAREITAYQKRAADSAVLDERRRMARDLHDGLNQELTYIASQAKHLMSLSEEVADDRMLLEHLASAAERALDESRRAIAALTLPIHEPFHRVLAHEAETVAARIGVALELYVDPTIEVDPATQESILRIVREAVSNAGRHGHAERISVELTNGKGVRLRVVDDGDGFDPAASERKGFGLISMRERARALGGEFRVASQPGDGTEIEILLP
jgi:signal transduction histidine kinase